MLSFSELALGQEEGLSAQLRSDTRVLTKGKKNKRPALTEEELHFSAQLPGKKAIFDRSEI